MKKTYQELKEAARQEAIQWQADFPNSDHSYGELAEVSAYFEAKAKRYGLTREFRENGII